MSARTITVFSVAGCTYCAKTKAALAQRTLAFNEISGDAFPERMAQAMEATGHKTLPMVFVGSHFIGGNSELQELLSEPSGLDGVPDSPPAAQLPAYLQDLSAEEAALLRDRPDAPRLQNAQSQQFSLGRGVVVSYDDVVKTMKGHDKSKTALKVIDRSSCFQDRRRTFKGEHLVSWLRSTYPTVKDDAAAVAVAGQLLEAKMFFSIDHPDTTSFAAEALYRLQDDVDTHMLNLQRKFVGTARPAAVVSEELRRYLTALVDQFMGGDAVDGEGLRASKEFAEFVQAVTELQAVDLSKLSRDELLAFGMNTYNLCVVHAFATVGPPEGWWGRIKFFTRVGYNIGGYDYSLNDIENGMLRGNRPAPGTFWAPFGAKDPRRAYVVSPVDYRIHCGLNCGAKSCPPVRAFHADTVEAELQANADAFMSGSVTFVPQEHAVYVSKIVSWYSKDFAPDPMATCLKHCSGELRQEVEAAAATKAVTLKYSPYDWSPPPDKKKKMAK